MDGSGGKDILDERSWSDNDNWSRGTETCSKGGLDAMGLKRLRSGIVQRSYWFVDCVEDLSTCRMPKLVEGHKYD